MSDAYIIHVHCFCPTKIPKLIITHKFTFEVSMEMVFPKLQVIAFVPMVFQSWEFADILTFGLTR